MSRKEIEEKIIIGFTEKISNDGWTLIEKKFRGDHYADYGKSVNKLDYRLSINFIKPSYLEYDNYVKIVSSEITDLYKCINKEFKGNCFEICSVRLNSIMHTKNANGIYNTSDTVRNKIDDKPILSDLDIEDLVEELYVNQYGLVENTIVEKTNTLEKLNYIFNILPYENNNSSKPNTTSYTTFVVRQVLVGSLLAVHFDMPEKQKILNRYLDYASKFRVGQNEDIDHMRSLINEYL